MQAVINVERLGMFELKLSKPVERILEYVHGTFTVRSLLRFKIERSTVTIIEKLAWTLP